MAWEPDITRATRAIANAQERFTRADIAQLTELSLSVVSRYIEVLERAGTVEVCRIGQRGIKIFRKTDKYRAPDEIKPENAPKQSRLDEKQLAQRAAESRLIDIDAAMRGWRKDSACA